MTSVHALYHLYALRCVSLFLPLIIIAHFFVGLRELRRFPSNSLFVHSIVCLHIPNYLFTVLLHIGLTLLYTQGAYFVWSCNKSTVLVKHAMNYPTSSFPTIQRSEQCPFTASFLLEECYDAPIIAPYWRDFSTWFG